MMAQRFRLAIPVAGLVARAAFRSAACRALSLVSVLAACAATMPLSPGLDPGELHHLKAGASTLLLGGVLLCVVAAPGGFGLSRGRGSVEAALSLPVPAEAVGLGLAAGLGAALAVFLLAGGSVWAATAAVACPTASLPRLCLAVAAVALLSADVACLAAALSNLFGPGAARALTVLLAAAGQAAFLFPWPAAGLLPPFDLLDPASLAAGTSLPDAAAWARGCATFGFYLCLGAGIRAASRDGVGQMRPPGGGLCE